MLKEQLGKGILILEGSNTKYQEFFSITSHKVIERKSKLLRMQVIVA